MNAKFFSDVRARRLPYTSKAKPEATGEAITKPRKLRRTAGAQLNPLQAALLEQLQLAGFCGRFWPMREAEVRRFYFTFVTHAQIFLTFSDPGTLAGARLHIQFATEDPQDKRQAKARKLLQEQFAPALEICERLAELARYSAPSAQALSEKSNARTL